MENDNSIFIEGFGLSGYRSFGPTLQKLYPLSKINLIIGQNNSGKSNILRFVQEHFNLLTDMVNQPRSNNGHNFSDLDKNSGSQAVTVAFPQPLDDASLSFIYDRSRIRDNRDMQVYLKALLSAEAIFDKNEDGVTWFPFKKISGTMQIAPEAAESLVEHFSTFQIAKHGYRSYTVPIRDLELSLTTSSNSDPQVSISNILRLISPPRLRKKTFAVDLIPAFRKVGEPEKLDFDHSGMGLINKLAQLQNPNLQDRHLTEQFASITQFLRVVTGSSTARIEIPYERDQILIDMDGRILPLDSLGTGIHEVIILAAASTILQNQVVCMEEPELHLHPVLQKKLVRYLKDRTTNQYFISTHSAHLLDTPDASIFHVSLENGQSKVRFVKSDKEKSLICNDLGYRASDILQANCVIWVEGPSDRTYLNHWIQAVDENLIEGLHYSIMFYGGRLLSHLSAEDPEITRFISLRRLNRNISILIDSDKSSSRKRINKTKDRVKKEFDKGPGFAWVTKGREVENYIDVSILENAVKEIHPSVSELVDKGDYDNRLKRFRNQEKKLRDTSKNASNLDKVKIALEVTKQPATLDALDLREKINTLVKFIREANDISETNLGR